MVRDALYVVHMATTPKSAFPASMFVVVKKGFTFGQATFQAIGYWTDKHPSEDDGSFDPDAVREITIPYSPNIRYIENVNYRLKN